MESDFFCFVFVLHRYISIGEGIIIHVSFLKKSTSAEVTAAVDSILNNTKFGPGRGSILEAQQDFAVLVVPQASLAGGRVCQE